MTESPTIQPLWENEASIRGDLVKLEKRAGVDSSESQEATIYRGTFALLETICFLPQADNVRTIPITESLPHVYSLWKAKSPPYLAGFSIKSNLYLAAATGVDHSRA